jgi:hypothetical protein
MVTIELNQTLIDVINNYPAINILTIITILTTAFVVLSAIIIFLADIYRKNTDYLQILTQIKDLYEQIVKKRNDFFQIYCQTILAIFVVFIIALLLLTKTISAEAGLPIITGIVAFVIGKSNTIDLGKKKDE